MFEFLKKVFSLKPKTVPTEAPYKVETPAPVLVVTNSNPADNVPVTENTAPSVAKAEPVAKKPRKPRQPKAPKTEASAITAKPKKAKAPSDKPKAPRKPKITIAK